MYLSIKSRMVLAVAPLLLIMVSCKQRIAVGRVTTFMVNVSSARNATIYLSRLPYIDEKKEKVDSAIVNNGTENIVFHVPYNPERLYELEVSGLLHKFIFIADADSIYMHANNANGKYTVTGSTATISLKRFNELQQVLYDSITAINRLLEQKHGSEAVTLKVVRDSIAKLADDNNYSYADTVSNPAAFIKIYNLLEFGNNHDSLLAFLTRASLRFKDYPMVESLRRDAVEMVSILKEEYKVGDQLPAIALPDIAGDTFSTKNLRGRYYLIDFWATWYPKTLPFNNVKKQVVQKYSQAKLQLVSVALDDDLAAWKNTIMANNFNWIQLIDEKMWRGVAARTLKFDSIPFNFLVNDKGVVLAKAIQPDSLLYILNRTIK